MLSAALLTIFIAYGSASIKSLTFDNNDLFKSNYINVNKPFTLYVTVSLSGSSETVEIKTVNDGYFSDTDVDIKRVTLTNGKNVIKFSFTPSKYYVDGSSSNYYYFQIGSYKTDGNFYASESTCGTTCSLCNENSQCLCNDPYCAYSKCSNSDSCPTCKTNYNLRDGHCVQIAYREITSNMVVLYELDRCSDFTDDSGSYSLLYTKKDDSNIYYYQYEGLGCAGEKQQRILDATFVEPSMKYRINYYTEKQCSNLINEGKLRNDDNSESLNKCTATSGGQYYMSECGKGYKEKNGECVEDYTTTCTDQHCTDCSTSPDYCYECDSTAGYTAKNGQCVKESTNSVVYGDPNGCKSGSTGDMSCKVNGESVEIHFCNSGCKDGYTPENINACSGSYSYCEKIDCSKLSNCDVCSSETTCEKCKTNYKPHNGKCIECKLDHCAECSTANVCVKCDSSEYIVNNGQCEKKPEGPVCDDKCIDCISDNNCRKCNTGYKPYNGKCIKCGIDHCNECSSTDYCSDCISPYTDKNGECVEEGIQCTVPKCETCSSNNYCTKCETNYEPINGKCIKPVGSLDGCNSNGKHVESCNDDAVYVCDSSCKSGFDEKYINLDVCEKSNLKYCEQKSGGDDEVTGDIAYWTDEEGDISFAPFDKCVYISSQHYCIVSKGTNADKINAKLYSIGDKTCTGGNGYPDTVTYDVSYTEPEKKYKLTYYSDSSCGSSYESGFLTDVEVIEELTDMYPLNECSGENGVNWKLTCGKGYKAENGKCVPSSENDDGNEGGEKFKCKNPENNEEFEVELGKCEDGTKWIKEGSKYQECSYEDDKCNKDLNGCHDVTEVIKLYCKSENNKGISIVVVLLSIILMIMY